jgi:exodeoxyribonuclease VII large subunit
VQGDGAAAAIAAAIHLLNDIARRASHFALDLILITRGGGSLEDLWAFNEEVVARAIFESALPVVSAVGHEIDFTISDFVADVRAATPSAAAELITEDVFASREFVAEAPALMAQRARQRLASEQQDFRSLVQRLTRAHPRRRLNEWLQRLDDLRSGVGRVVRQRVREGRVGCEHFYHRLLRARPAVHVQQRQDLVKQHRRVLREAVRLGLQRTQHRLATAQARLRLLGPEQVLGRGYSITIDAGTGRVLRNANDIQTGQRLKTRLQQGEIFSRAESD